MSLFVRERRIRFSDCDPAGIVFYPQYFVMFNGLVEDWVNEGLGLSYHGMVIERGIGLPTVHLDADFKAVSPFGDRVRLQLAVSRLGRSSIGLSVSCVGQEAGDLRIRMNQVLVATSLRTHRAIDIPPELRAAIEAFGMRQ
ncbi:MAG TPA: thioesterase family protein [Rubrivivax sp.]|nr:acyl-CoA thioesterase [Burkholderiales bacterium]HNT38477.1 thioesterase family protein [Rubrivivax sp.]